MNAREINSLRKKFIFISMFSILLVMLFIGGAINTMYYAGLSLTIKPQLTAIAKTNGNLNDNDDTERPDASFSRAFSPAYQRNDYFVFLFTSRSNAPKLMSSNASNETREKVKGFAKDFLITSKSYGRLGQYFYLKENIGNNIRLTVLNCEPEIRSFLWTVTATIIVCAIAFIITFILIFIFSKRAVQPEIENSERQKEFITNASHELKTPLAVIRANTELTEITYGESEWTQSTLNEVDHMNGLIQNLVMIAKSEEKENNSIREIINVSDVVNESIAPYKSLAAQEGIALKTNIDNDVKMLIEESKIRQLTAIIIDNAIKYCDDQGSISVSLLQNKKGAKLIVSNSYKNGSETDCSRFFDRFYREDKSHNNRKSGYGIGLSIAEKICSDGGGSIKASWKDGIITFTCSLC